MFLTRAAQKKKKTDNLKRAALKSMCKALSSHLPMSVFVIFIFVHATHTHKHTHYRVIYSKHRAGKLKQVFQVGFQLQV